MTGCEQDILCAASEITMGGELAWDSGGDEACREIRDRLFGLKRSLATAHKLLSEALPELREAARLQGVSRMYAISDEIANAHETNEKRLTGLIQRIKKEVEDE